MQYAGPPNAQLFEGFGEHQSGDYSTPYSKILHSFERGYLILSAMAERIKYLYINSANQGTQRQSEPNSSTEPRQYEPNSTVCTRQTEPNSASPPSEADDIGLVLTTAENSSDPNLFDYEDETGGNSESAADEGSPRVIGGYESDPPAGKPSSDSGKDPDEDRTEKEDSQPTDFHESTASADADASASTTEAQPLHSVTPTPSFESSADVDVLPPVATRDELIDAQRPSEMVDGPLRGVAYYRTSTEDENEKDARITIDQQKPLVQAAFKAFRIDNPHEPIKDRAVSGEVFEEREGLEKIEELAKAGEINVLVVSDIDRLGRVCEKTIEFVKRLRNEYDVYIVSNVRWYDVTNGDDLETFNAKAGRAEAENKKRGGRGNRGKLFKIVENGSDSYLSWFKSVPTGMVKSNPDDDSDKGIELANGPKREIPRVVLNVFKDIQVQRHAYAETEKEVRERLKEKFGPDFEPEFDVKTILTDPIYTGRKVIEIHQAETHSVDQAEMAIEMSDLRLFDDDEVELWTQAQKKIAQIKELNKDKDENRPEKLLSEYGWQLVDEEVASWTLICPTCGSTGSYEYYGKTIDADGTNRQKCKCTGGDDNYHFFRVPTREEWEALEERSRT